MHRIEDLTPWEYEVLTARLDLSCRYRRAATCQEIADSLDRPRQTVYQVLYRLSHRGHLIREGRQFRASDDPDWDSLAPITSLEGHTETHLRLIVELSGPSKIVLRDIDAAIERLTQLRAGIQGDTRKRSS